VLSRQFAHRRSIQWFHFLALVLATVVFGAARLSAAVPVISSSSTASGQVGVAFSYQITASNTPTSFSATGLPAGLSVNSTSGLISGTPTTAATTSVTLGATNASGTGTKTLTLTVKPPTPVITSPLTATGQKGVAFSYQVTATNSPTSYSATGLPTGMPINSTTGVISGTPSTAATTNVTIKATSAGGTGSATLVLTINPATPVISSTATATGQIGSSFSYQIVASNTPTSFNATGLPSGLSVNTSTGLISGNPTTLGSSSVSLSASNAGGTGTKTLTLTINPPTPVITSTLSATGQKGVAFSYQITATNSPTSYAATSLPSGLTVSTSTGLISGSPTTAATTNVTIKAINAGGTGTATLVLAVNPATPVISSAATASGQTGYAFSYQITASNTPTSYSAAGLPAGLSVNTATGLISGAPTAIGSSTITLGATNAGGTGNKTLTLTVTLGKPVISSPTSAAGTIGSSFSYQIIASNGPTSYGATGLPAGLSVNTSTGLITGSPTTVGTTSVSIKATNASRTTIVTLVLTVNQPTSVITSPGNATGQVGASFSYQIAASNSPTAYDATGLPAGLSINTTTGLISGTATQAGTYAVTILVTNAGGTISATLVLSILPPLPFTADFENSEGYAIGSLHGQLGWTVTQGSAAVNTADHANGTQAVQLAASVPPTVVTQKFFPVSGQTIEHFDFFAKPIAGTDLASANNFNVESAKFGFLLNGAQGNLRVFNGDGSGGGTWISTPYSISLGAGNQTQNWVRLTARLDFTTHKWDLYANGQMVMADVSFILNTSTALSTFQAQGDTATSSGVDYIYVGPTNPLFADTNSNGIDDAWETAHGLSLANNNRNLSPAGNGTTVIQAYVNGTDPNDYFNGNAPTLTILGGNNQTAPAGQFNTQPFDVGVWNTAGTAPLANAPVTFMVQSGGGKLAVSNVGNPTLSTTLNLLTDVNGTAQVYYQHSTTASLPSQIEFNAGSSQLTFSTASDAPLNLPSTIGGLRLWLRADAGITLDANGNVATWSDQSTFHSDAIQNTSGSRPALVSNALNGQPVLRFNGSNTYFQLPNVMSGVTLGAEIIAVLRAPDAGTRIDALWDFGVSGNGSHYYNGYRYDDFGTNNGSSYTGAPALLLSEYHRYNISIDSSGTWIDRVNGVEWMRRTNQPLGFRSNPMIGRSVPYGQNLRGDIAEIIIYDHALSAADRDAVSAYLTTKYIAVPTAPANLQATPISSTQTELSWTIPNVGLHTITSIERQTGSGSYEKIAEVNDGLSYLDTGLSGGAIYNYRVSARSLTGSSGYSEVATATTLIAGEGMPLLGLKLWLKAGVGMTLDGDGHVAGWADQSGGGFNANQNTRAYRPQLVGGVVNGRPVVRFDGVDDSLRLSNPMSGVTAGAEIIAVVKAPEALSRVDALWHFGTGNASLYAVDGRWDDFGITNGGNFSPPPVALLREFHYYNISIKNGTWVERVNGIEQYRRINETLQFRNDPAIGARLNYPHWLKGDIAEIIIYNHELSPVDREAVNVYLTKKYAPPFAAIPPAPTDLQAKPISSAQVSLAWVVPNLSSHAVTVIERRNGFNGFTPVAEVEDVCGYTDTGLIPGTPYEYRVKLRGFSGSSDYSLTVSTTTPSVVYDQVPLNGMRLWLKADAGTTIDSDGNVSLWKDQSGLGNNSFQNGRPYRPKVVAGAANGYPVIRFDGIDDSLNLPTNLMNGVSGAEIIAVVKTPEAVSRRDCLWHFGSAYGSLYYNGTRYDDFGTNSTENYPAPGVSVLSRYHYYNVAVGDGIWTDRLNGDVQRKRTGQIISFRSDPAIGKRLDYPDFLKGDIAEIIIYNRVLSDVDRESIAYYLNLKYALSLPLLVTGRYADHNGDGLTDVQDAALGFDPYGTDVDGDGIPNYVELANGTDAINPDTDHDGVPDNLDAYPIDPARWQAVAQDPNDHTPPVVTLTSPTQATLN